MSLNLPSEEIMRQMAKLAMEEATEFFAMMADQFAADPRVSIMTAPLALQTFAKAIRETNRKQFPAATGSDP